MAIQHEICAIHAVSEQMHAGLPLHWAGRTEIQFVAPVIYEEVYVSRCYALRCLMTSQLEVWLAYMLGERLLSSEQRRKMSRSRWLEGGICTFWKAAVDIFGLDKVVAGLYSCVELQISYIIWNCGSRGRCTRPNAHNTDSYAACAFDALRSTCTKWCQCLGLV